MKSGRANYNTSAAAVTAAGPFEWLHKLCASQAPSPPAHTLETVYRSNNDSSSNSLIQETSVTLVRVPPSQSSIYTATGPVWFFPSFSEYSVAPVVAALISFLCFLCSRAPLVVLAWALRASLLLLSLLHTPTRFPDDFYLICISNKKSVKTRYNRG